MKEFLKISGSAKFQGNLKGNDVVISGSSKIAGNAIGESIRVSGSVSVEGNCEGTEVTISGSANIKGLLSGDKIYLNGPSGYIKEIGGSEITIKDRNNVILFGIIRFNSGKGLNCELIEGDTIELENVKCDLVRGHNIKIGENCRIKMVEYTGSIEIDKKSKVEEFVSIK